MRVGAPSGDGQYTIHEYGIAASLPGNSNTAGKTLVSPAIVPGQKTLIFIVPGQSLTVNNNGSTLYTPTNSLIHNLNVYDGNVYEAIDPMLGCSLAGDLYTWMPRLGDNLINAGDCARVIFVPIGIGSSSSFDWSSGELYSRLQVAANRIRALGWNATAVLAQQGQQDAALGTSSAVYQANWKLAQQILIGQGINVPWLFASPDTMLNGVTNATIAGAQSALINPSQNRYQGPDVDALTVAGGYRLADKTHLSDDGLIAIAGTGSSGWQTAIENMHF